MKLFGKIAAIAGAVILVTAGAVCVWLYLYTADLPSIADLYRYNPTTASEIQVRAGSLTHVVPSDLLGKYVVSALLAAAGQVESRGPIRATISSLFSAVHPYMLRCIRGSLHAGWFSRVTDLVGRLLNSDWPSGSSDTLTNDKF